MQNQPLNKFFSCKIPPFYIFFIHLNSNQDTNATHKSNTMIRTVSPARLVIGLLFAMLLTVQPTTAQPNTATVRLPDGSSLPVQIHGDARFHYETTIDGYPVVQGPDGFYYYLTDSQGRSVRSAVRVSARNRRTAEELRLLATLPHGVTAGARLRTPQSQTRVGLETGFPTTGDVRSLVILVNFSDVTFTTAGPQRAFERMLNEKGYSDNGAIGSARDYYLQNSGERFRPTFDVVGPFTLDHPVAYYGANTDYRDPNAEKMIVDACRKAAAAGVDFAQYDLDNDGKIDNVFVYYAGYNESEGGGSNTVWPHRGEVSDSGETFNGKTLCVYACTSELSGSEGFDSRMAGIGTFCHEFGHVLGWPDFYDTDGSDSGTGSGIFNWSLMCRGSLNDGGRIPPALTAVERMLAGWLTPTVLSRSGDYTLQPIQENEACLIRTDTEGEFFLLENRQLTGWDQALKGHGLLIYHVDRSQRLVEGYTALDRWIYNIPNNIAAHPCLRLITARPDSGEGYEAFMPYPGQTGNREFSASSRPAARSWSGAPLPAEVYDITETTDGTIRFSVRMAAGSIEELRIEGRERAIVGDTVQMRAVISPEGASGDLEWSSDNEAVATIDARSGTVTCLKSGETTIRVTAPSTGASAGFQLSVVEGTLLRGRVWNSAKSPLEGVRIELSDQSGECLASFTSDEEGCFASGENEVSEGSYSLQLRGEGYPAQAVAARIGAGTTRLDLTLQQLEEMDRGDAGFEVSVQPFQNSVYIDWSGSDATRWTVEWRPMETAFYAGSRSVETPQIDIDGLSPRSEYAVRITESDGAESKYRMVYFSTAEPLGRFTGMALQAEYETDTPVLLKAVNNPDGARQEWFIDGEAVSQNSVRLPAGEHEVELHISTSGHTEIITKYITVK